MSARRFRARGISPRISFSYDLNRPNVLSNEDHCRRSDLTLLDSSSDFVFCIGNRFAQEMAPADELFSNGKIRAKEIKRKVTSPDETSIQSESISSRPRPSYSGNTEKKQLRELLSNNFDAEEKPPSKSFWQFKRSSSHDLSPTFGPAALLLQRTTTRTPDHHREPPHSYMQQHLTQLCFSHPKTEQSSTPTAPFPPHLNRTGPRSCSSDQGQTPAATEAANHCPDCRGLKEVCSMD
ncbi:hypothetical protein F2P56_036502 [Juglans regia]|uniref:Uncharacterized protein n=2 Tax=Juglans regia TaxID=51240 RepID=A0A833WTE9_JUGRE|nr:uncharacterized protein LOC108980610 [Juglans regia]KAF5443994.1 hypothetical protein F2P56_036502 [Juglans regia]